MRTILLVAASNEGFIQVAAINLQNNLEDGFRL